MNYPLFQNGVDSVMNLPSEIKNEKPVPVVFVKSSGVFANSRDVAEFFEKRHDHVLRDVDALIAAAPEAAPNFGVSEYRDSTGRRLRCFEMTRDGFTLLAMGFTGSKALQWKLRYIEAFNAMEAQLRRQQEVPTINLHDPKQLLQLLNDYAAKAIELEAQVDELRPSADALDRIAGIEGSMSITAAAKNLQVQPNVLFGYLRKNGWVYKRTGGKEELAYQAKIDAGLLEHKVTTVQKADGSDLVVTQVRVTPKGLARLAKALGGMPGLLQ